MQENYRIGMVDPTRRVGEYLGRHRRTETGGKRRRVTACPLCNGSKYAGVGGMPCSRCAGSGAVPMPAFTDPTTYRGAHAARSTR